MKTEFRRDRLVREARERVLAPVPDTTPAAAEPSPHKPVRDAHGRFVKKEAS